MLRSEKSITQAELAEMLGVSNRSISRWLHCKIKSIRNAPEKVAAKVKVERFAKRLSEKYDE